MCGKNIYKIPVVQKLFCKFRTLGVFRAWESANQYLGPTGYWWPQRYAVLRVLAGKVFAQLAPLATRPGSRVP